MAPCVPPSVSWNAPFLECQIRPGIGRCKRARGAVPADGCRAQRRNVDDRAVAIVCDDLVVRGVSAGGVSNDEVSAAADMNAAIVADAVVGFDAAVVSDCVDAGPIAGPETITV